jgi:hypothetical protein
MPTTWTQTDLATLEAAIASGTRHVQYGDKSVTYQTIEQMLRARSEIMSAVGGSGSPRKFFAYHSKGL